MAETTGGTIIGRSTKPTSTAAKRGRNIQMPRLKASANSVASVLETMPTRRLSRMLSSQRGSSISAR